MSLTEIRHGCTPVFWIYNTTFLAVSKEPSPLTAERFATNQLWPHLSLQTCIMIEKESRDIVSMRRECRKVQGLRWGRGIIETRQSRYKRNSGLHPIIMRGVRQDPGRQVWAVCLSPPLLYQLCILKLYFTMDWKTSLMLESGDDMYTILLQRRGANFLHWRI